MEAFFAAAVRVPAKAGRFMAIGELGGTVVTVVAAGLGSEAISVVSMRRADRKERRLCMARIWPSFTTRDLGDSPEDDAEMARRWERYNTEMQAIIAAGGVHQDVDGWWIDDATGDLIGPDPEVERPQTDEELAQALPFSEAVPRAGGEHSAGAAGPRRADAAECPRRSIAGAVGRRSRARSSRSRYGSTPTCSPSSRRPGRGWQGRVNEILRKAVG